MLIFAHTRAREAKPSGAANWRRALGGRHLHSRATEQKVPAKFKETVDAIVPSTIKIEPVPSKATSNVPALKSYDFARVNGKLLIVNPSNKKVAEVIGG